MHYIMEKNDAIDRQPRDSAAESPPMRARATPPRLATGSAAATAAYYVSRDIARTGMLPPLPRDRASSRDRAHDAVPPLSIPVPGRWTPAMEALARRAMKKAARLAWQYEAVAEAARKLGDGLSLVSGILGGLVGTGGVVGATAPGSVSLLGVGSGAVSWPTLISIVIGYVISVIAILMSNWRLSEIQMKGVAAQTGLLNTAREIRWQLAQPLPDRADAHEFVHAREAEIAQVEAAAPPRDEWVRKKYRSMFLAEGAINDEEALDWTPPPTPPVAAPPAETSAIEIIMRAGAAPPDNLLREDPLRALAIIMAARDAARARAGEPDQNDREGATTA